MERSTPRNDSDEPREFVGPVIGTPEHQAQVNARWQARQARQGGQLSIPGTDIATAYRNRIGKLQEFGQTNSVEVILKRVWKNPIRPRQQRISLNDACDVVEALYTRELSAIGRKVYFEDCQWPIVIDVIKYFIADPSCPYSLTKGLFLYGPVGTGKSFLLHIMQMLCQLVPIPEMQFNEILTKEIMRQIEIAKSMKPLDALLTNNLLLGDLGDEDKQVSLYAKNKRPMLNLLDARYEAWQRNRLLTHATSNYDPDDVALVYGTRIEDRFSELWEPILFPGKSKRTTDETSTKDDGSATDQ